jgi:hypothetical protein
MAAVTAVGNSRGRRDAADNSKDAVVAMVMVRWQAMV